MHVRFRCVDITHRGVTRCVLLFCHIRKDEPRRTIQRCCLCDIKTAVHPVVYYDRFNTHYSLRDYIRSTFNEKEISEDLFIHLQSWSLIFLRTM